MHNASYASYASCAHHTCIDLSISYYWYRVPRFHVVLQVTRS
jgi:hypothetical protein